MLAFSTVLVIVKLATLAASIVTLPVMNGVYSYCCVLPFQERVQTLISFSPTVFGTIEKPTMSVCPASMSKWRPPTSSPFTNRKIWSLYSVPLLVIDTFTASGVPTSFLPVASSVPVRPKVGGISVRVLSLIMAVTYHVSEPLLANHCSELISRLIGFTI